MVLLAFFEADGDKMVTIGDRVEGASGLLLSRPLSQLPPVELVVADCPA